MFRVLGFLTGAALVIGAMVVVLGSPELRDNQTLAPVEVKVERLDLPATAEPVVVPAAPMVEIPAPAEPVADVASPAEPVADVPPPEVLQEPNWSLEELPEVEPSPPASVEPASPAAVLAEAIPPLDAVSEAAEPAAPAHDSQWQSIWNPFRSEIAANGFAGRLTAVTGIDYRVVRLKPGAYQVAFAYADDNERATKVAQIETATGLELPEATP